MLSVEEAIFRKPEPNRSIKPEPIGSTPNHHFECDCLMCRQYPHIKMMNTITENEKKLGQKIGQINKNNPVKQKSSYYQWVLKKLMLPHNKIVLRGVQIFIPETCFYKDGQVEAMYLNKELNEFSMKRITKEKLNNTVLQKLFNERRRKYRQKMAALHKKHPVVQKKSYLPQKKEPRVDAKDAVIVRQTDGGEKLISQNQLISMLLKRKQDPIWRTIEYIKTFINANEPNTYMATCKYDHHDVKFQLLFQRASTLIKVFGMNIREGDRDYISQKDEAQFTRQLRANSMEAFSAYMVYQIVHFIEYFYDEKIYKMTTKVLVNELGQFFLLQVYKLDKRHQNQLVRFNWTNETYNQKLIDEQYQTFYTQKIPQSQALERNAGLIEEQMRQQYQFLKNQFGLSVEEQDDHQQIANNQCFRKLHPEFNQDISDVFKNDKDLGVNRFKRVYLGFRSQKKPIVKPFHSNLVKTLHSMTPRLRVASPHDYVGASDSRRHSSFGKESRFGRDSRKHSFSHTTGFNTPVRTLHLFN